MCFLGCIVGLLLGGASLAEARPGPSVISLAPVEVRVPGLEVAAPVAEMGPLPRVRPVLVPPIVIAPPVSIAPVAEPHVMPPCCQARKDRQVSETVDVDPPRLKSLQASAEEPVAAERTLIVAVASGRLFDAYEQDEDDHGPPCCESERRDDPVEAEPPRLKNLSAAAEVTIPAERKLAAAVASRRLPPASEPALDVQEPPWRQAEPRKDPVRGEPSRWKDGQTWAEMTLGATIALLLAAGVLYALQRRGRRRDVDLRPGRVSSSGKTSLPEERPSADGPAVAVVAKVSSPRVLEDA
jgi:hypothetical protein